MASSASVKLLCLTLLVLWQILQPQKRCSVPFSGIFGKVTLSRFSEELKLKSERKEERPLSFFLDRIDG